MLADIFAGKAQMLRCETCNGSVHLLDRGNVRLWEIDGVQFTGRGLPILWCARCDCEVCVGDSKGSDLALFKHVSDNLAARRRKVADANEWRPAVITIDVRDVAAAVPAAPKFVRLVATGSLLLSDVLLGDVPKRQIDEFVQGIRHLRTVHAALGQLGEEDNGCTALVLFGKPGTGKTMLAKAIANEITMPLVAADVSQVRSRFLGESGKNVAAAFQEAEKLRAVLFLDEADSLLAKRSDVSDDARHEDNCTVNELLKLLEHHKLPVILATNLRQQLDKAVDRRVVSVEIPVPDQALRRRMWRHFFAQTPQAHLLNDSWIAELDGQILAADKAVADAFTAAEIKQVMRAAARAVAPSTTISRQAIESALRDRLVTLIAVPKREDPAKLSAMAGTLVGSIVHEDQLLVSELRSAADELADIDPARSSDPRGDLARIRTAVSRRIARVASAMDERGAAAEEAGLAEGFGVDAVADYAKAKRARATTTGSCAGKK